MSIRQLPSCCYAFTDPAEDGERHYPDLQDASAELIEARKGNPETTAAVTRLDYRCWVVQCDGECEQTLDEEDEGIVYHHDSPEAAGKTAGVFKFRLAPGPSGETLAYCETDAPGGAEVPPLSPDEQERAGQQRLPGIIP
jgi:hypothetical protein